MKAVIVELRDGYASVLSDDGCVVKIKNNNYKIGQVIQIKKSRNHMINKIAMFTASAAAILILSVGTWAYASPYSYVSLDVNPSMEFVLNRFDRVIGIMSINEDGEEVLQEIKLSNLKHKTIVNAIHQALDQITNLGYLSNDTYSGIVITTSGKNMQKANELALDIKEEVEQDIIATDDTSVEVYSVGMERVEAARELGVTPGKLNLVEKLISSSDESEIINLEEWLNKPVKDIMKATKENSKAFAVTGSAIIIDDTKATEKATKEAIKEMEKAEREAIKEKEKTERENSKAERDTAKEKEKTERENSKANRDAAKDKEKAERQNFKADRDVAKDKEKAERQNSKADRDVAKDKEKAERENSKANRDAAKDKEKAERQNSKADRDVAKDKEKAERHSSKADRDVAKDKEKDERQSSKADRAATKKKDKANRKATKNNN